MDSKCNRISNWWLAKVWIKMYLKNMVEHHIWCKRKKKWNDIKIIIILVIILMMKIMPPFFLVINVWSFIWFTFRFKIELKWFCFLFFVKFFLTQVFVCWTFRSTKSKQTKNIQNSMDEYNCDIIKWHDEKF